MKADKIETKEDCRRELERTGRETQAATSRASVDDSPQKVYLLNTKHLRISSTKKWAKVLDQLRKQIRTGSELNGGIQDHFC